MVSSAPFTSKKILPQLSQAQYSAVPEETQVAGVSSTCRISCLCTPGPIHRRMVSRALEVKVILIPELLREPRLFARMPLP